MDIILTDDIVIKDGDLLIEEADSQDIQIIVQAKPGQFYQFPTLGVGIQDFKNGPANKQSIRQIIRRNLKSDGFRVRSIEITDDLIIAVDAIR